MPKTKITKNKFINWINVILDDKKILSPETGKIIQIPTFDDKDLNSKNLNEQNAIFQLAITLSNNYIMNEIPNVIRAQIYDWLTGNPILSDFDFWRKPNGQGLEVIHEGKILTSTRTGVIGTDAALISPEPLNEIQVLELTEQTTADQRQTFSIQEWSTIPSAVNWLNERIQNLKSSIDQVVHDTLKLNIEEYTGYLTINIDDTGLTPEELAFNIEQAVGENIANMTSGYSTDYSEAISGTTKLVGKSNLSDIGLIFANNSVINREIGYLRKQVRLTEGNMPKDWGVGEIINKQFEDETIAVIAINKNKWIWDSFEIMLDTALGFSGIKNLATLMNFYGNIFMKSGQSFKITIGTETQLIKRINSSKEKQINKIKDSLKILENEKQNSLLKEILISKNKITDTSFKSYLINLKNQLNERLNLINENIIDNDWFKKNIRQHNIIKKIDKNKDVVNALNKLNETISTSSPKDKKNSVELATVISLLVETLKNNNNKVKIDSKDKEQQFEKKNNFVVEKLNNISAKLEKKE